ncbi:MAG TPA: DUF6089 family protein [Saprospiraceae bacterium]|nr:DUF6089 family protein [Saprospiraceae bacterium]
MGFTQHTRKILFGFFCSIFSFFPLSAQSLEVGAFLGFSNYLGELQSTHFEKAEMHNVYGGFTRVNFTKRLGLRLHYFQGEVSGSDLNYPYEEIRARNLSFRTSLQEFGIQGEFALVNFGENKKKIGSAYIFGGVSGLHFAPKALYEGDWIDLQPLGTEGQGLEGYGERYNLTTLAFPMGLGFRINIKKFANIGFEIGFRKTQTDYIDDVSGAYPDLELLTGRDPMAAALSFREPEYNLNAKRNPVGEMRGDPDSKDWYYFCGITLSAYIFRADWYLPK